MTVEEENQYLKEENKALKARLEEADKAAEKGRRDTEFAERTVGELAAKIKNLEGQIEAYQYCVNSRLLQ